MKDLRRSLFQSRGVTISEYFSVALFYVLLNRNARYQRHTSHLETEFWDLFLRTTGRTNIVDVISIFLSGLQNAALLERLFTSSAVLNAALHTIVKTLHDDLQPLLEKAEITSKRQ